MQGKQFSLKVNSEANRNVPVCSQSPFNRSSVMADSIAVIIFIALNIRKLYALRSVRNWLEKWGEIPFRRAPEAYKDNAIQSLWLCYFKEGKL